MPFELTVSGFAPGGWIPERHTCEGPDVSPALSWSGAPDETKSGVQEAELPKLAEALFVLPHLTLRGLKAARSYDDVHSNSGKRQAGD